MSGFTFDDPTGTSSYSQSGSTIRIASGPKTDYWTTAPGSVPESSAHRASAPVLYQLHKLAPTANWRLKGSLHQPGTERFQQTTLFLRRVNPNEGANGEDQKWLKSGIEIEQGRQFIGVVVSDPFSDWNVAPLASAPGKDAAKVDVEIEKVGPDVHVYYTPTGEKSRILLREKKGFAPPTDAEHETWWFGAMVCGPLSESTEGTVENWTFEPITDAQH